MANLTRWNPFAELEEMLDRYSRGAGFPRQGNDRETRDLMRKTDWSPAVDIAETPTAYIISAELPGIDRKDVKVTVNDGVLLIQGERHSEKEDKDRKHHRVERFYGTFARSFSLPDNVNEDSIQADYKDGMLKVTLEKSEKAKPKSIEVQVN